MFKNINIYCTSPMACNLHDSWHLKFIYRFSQIVIKIADRILKPYQINFALASALTTYCDILLFCWHDTNHWITKGRWAKHSTLQKKYQHTIAYTYDTSWEDIAIYARSELGSFQQIMQTVSNLRFNKLALFTNISSVQVTKLL